MPIYTYRCDECGARFEARRSFTDADTPTFCSACGAEAKRTIGVPQVLIRTSLASGDLEFSPRRAASYHPVGCPCCGPRRR